MGTGRQQMLIKKYSQLKEKQAFNKQQKGLSLPDTELAKNILQQIIGSYFTGDLP